MAQIDRAVGHQGSMWVDPLTSRGAFTHDKCRSGGIRSGVGSRRSDARGKADRPSDIESPHRASRVHWLPPRHLRIEPIRASGIDQTKPQLVRAGPLWGGPIQHHFQDPVNLPRW